MTRDTFNNPLPVAVILVRTSVNDVQGVLAGCRTIAPHNGQFALPGGYVESTDQSFESAAARELYEEMGISIPVSDITLSHSIITGAHILVFCVTKNIISESSIRNEFRKSGECSAWKVVHGTESLAFPTHSDAVARLLSTPFAAQV